MQLPRFKRCSGQALRTIAAVEQLRLPTSEPVPFFIPFDALGDQDVGWAIRNRKRVMRRAYGGHDEVIDDHLRCVDQPVGNPRSHVREAEASSYRRGLRFTVSRR